MGPGSEVIGGIGELTYDEMLQNLRDARCYLYTGTQPASYTLGLIEAMMTGIPVVSIGPKWMTIFPYGPDLFEGHEFVQFEPVEPLNGEHFGWSNDPEQARTMVRLLLEDKAIARLVGGWGRGTAIELFGRETIGAHWKAYLGAP